jgi:hypothetical protein
MAGLAKLAASFDAQRNKQYWQMLKRLHGGSDEAVEKIKTTGDSGIYHGTIDRNVPGIEEKGLLPASREGLGAGQYFGDKPTADFYAQYSHGTPAMMRFKKPSELSGTKELYPDVNKASKFDFNDGRVRYSHEQEASEAFREKNRDLQHQINTTKYSLPSRITDYLDHRNYKGLLNNNGKYKQALNKEKALEEEGSRIRKSVDVGGEPSTIAPNMHKFRYYGKSPSEYVEDRDPGTLLFRDQPTISPSLLKRELDYK